ncbi:MAG TPA: biopolymer transporter ExbD [Pirellulales bacterium]
MSSMNSLASSFSSGSLTGKHDEELDLHVDMTAMIDLVFMLTIFFLLTSLATALAELDLPMATHVTAADMETSLLISVVAKGKGDRAQVYIGEIGSGELVPDAQLDERIASAVQQALKEGRKNVIVKAEKGVSLGTDARIGSAVAAASEDMKLNFAVMEKD